ncbi:hypothetical protein GDO86_020404 [Hymenochirus boettgeri]|uniref:Uncharacterized protein n=1 Tax=Hymenochirus boettgeri TaxID=247094 RepID=A0A8T2ID86_9PIPI|nr:hypothetical protein GDO86_020404 [Hymenochirus boettgeri]
MGEAGGGEVLEAPVPVVIVIGAKLCHAAHQLVVQLSGHSYGRSVLWRYPAAHFHMLGVRRRLYTGSAPQAKQLAPFLFTLVLHETQSVLPVGEQVTSLLQEHHIPSVAAHLPQPLPREVELPPPVMFVQGESCFSVVAVAIRVPGIVAPSLQGRFLGQIPWAVVGIHSWKFLRVEAQAVGEVDGQHPAEVYRHNGIHSLAARLFHAQHQQKATIGSGSCCPQRLG